MEPTKPVAALAIAEQRSAEVIEPGYTFSTVTDKISTIVLTRKTPLGWFLALGVSFSLLMLLLYAVGTLFLRGIGIWGVNVPVGWGFAIINFVWWIGIGHAGTLISAILLLLRQRWRTSINPFAQAMTVVAVACARLFPLLPPGRPRFFYRLRPPTHTLGPCPQWRSPPACDASAVPTSIT